MERKLPSLDRAACFSDEAMAGWFRAAGLDPDLTEHLTGGELTVTLWRGVKLGALDRKAA